MKRFLSTLPAEPFPRSEAVIHDRRAGLDLVRALAIVFVLICHGVQYWAPYLPFINSTKVGWVAGIDGVELFFCLSGFLIGSILLDIQDRGNRPEAVRIFLIRRWMRTLPLYFLTLFIFTFPAVEPSEKQRAWQYFLLIQNFWQPMPPSNWFGTSWSLTIEEWSYLALPALSMFVFSSKKSPLFWAALTMILAAFISRTIAGVTYQISSPSQWDDLIRKVVVTRFDAVAYGVVMAISLHQISDLVRRWLCILGIALTALNICVLYLSDNFVYAWFGWTVLFPMTGVGFAAIIPTICRVSVPLMLIPPVQFLAKISYPLYLVHWAFLFSAAKFSAPYNLFIFIGGSFLAATILSLLIEQPIMRLRPKQI